MSFLEQKYTEYYIKYLNKGNNDSDLQFNSEDENLRLKTIIQDEKKIFDSHNSLYACKYHIVTYSKNFILYIKEDISILKTNIVISLSSDKFQDSKFISYMKLYIYYLMARIIGYDIKDGYIPLYFNYSKMKNLSLLRIHFDIKLKNYKKCYLINYENDNISMSLNNISYIYSDQKLEESKKIVSDYENSHLINRALYRGLLHGFSDDISPETYKKILNVDVNNLLIFSIIPNKNMDLFRVFILPNKIKLYVYLSKNKMFETNNYSICVEKDLVEKLM